MDNKLWILLYSKFSPVCDKFLTFIQENNINIPFNLLSIDGKEMRSRILRQDNMVSIKQVPCIICIEQSTGIANQYEGVKAFELVGKMIEIYRQSVEPQITFRSNEQPNGTLHEPIEPEKVSFSTPIESLIEEESDDPENTHVPIPMKEVPIKAPGGKISVSSVMKMANRETTKQSQNRPEQPEPVQSGGKISVAEIMAGRG